MYVTISMVNLARKGSMEFFVIAKYKGSVDILGAYQTEKESKEEAKSIAFSKLLELKQEGLVTHSDEFKVEMLDYLLSIQSVPKSYIFN